MSTIRPVGSKFSRTGFTLVELLVVIGIIAVLISILLPTLSRVRSQARDVQCQSNMRSLVQLTMVYASANKGSLPYGEYPTPVDPVTWAPIGGTTLWIGWWSVLDQLARKTTVDDNTRGAAEKRSEIFICATAQSIYPHLLSYVANMNLMPRPSDESGFGPNFLRRPARLAELKRPLILFHDTSIRDGWSNNVGFLVNYDVDNQTFLDGTNLSGPPDTRRFAQLRFDVTPSRMFTTAAAFQPSARVSFPPDWRNTDPTPPTGQGFGYQGNMRFRHQKDNAVALAYSDGRVEMRTGRPASFTSSRVPQGWITDIQRRDFMPPYSMAISRTFR